MQFLHHSAQKLITIGSPLLSNEAVFIVFPSSVFMSTEGIIWETDIWEKNITTNKIFKNLIT